MRRSLPVKICSLNKCDIIPFFFISFVVFLALMIANNYNRLKCVEILEKKWQIDSI